jgi:hypothetical protein
MKHEQKSTLPAFAVSIFLFALGIATAAHSHRLERVESMAFEGARHAHEMHCHNRGTSNYCFSHDPPPQKTSAHPYDCPQQLIRRSFRSRVELTCPQ